MFSKDDRQFLNHPHYSMALEKFFSRELGLKHYSEQNDINRREKKVGMNLAIETVYPFSNEDMYENFRNLDVKGQNVATTGSSGDQMLMAIACGAKKVTLIDGNLYSKYYIDYKFAAIKNLSYEEFKKYFIDSNQYFDFNLFQRIFHDLDKDSQTFWGSIYSQTTDPNLIRNRITNNNNQRPLTDFLYSENVYPVIQKALLNNKYELEYQIAEFNDFPEVLNEKYAAILLSNIFQYVNPNDYVRVVYELEEKLIPGGKIQLTYEFPNMLGNQKPDKTESFKKFFQNKENKIYSTATGDDRVYFLEKLKDKVSDLEN